MVREFRTQITIHASADRVWEVLTDFAAYPSWNPFIRAISGNAVLGGKLVIKLQGFGTSTMRFSPRVLTVRKPQELRWLGRLGIPGLFDGEHSFTIAPADPGSVLFTQAETFRGILVPLVWRRLERGTKPMFGRMNEALRARSEAPAA
jgi:hypothetical protein